MNRADLVERSEIIREKGTTDRPFRGERQIRLGGCRPLLPALGLVAAYLLAQLESVDEIAGVRWLSGPLRRRGARSPRRRASRPPRPDYASNNAHSLIDPASLAPGIASRPICGSRNIHATFLTSASCSDISRSAMTGDAASSRPRQRLPGRPASTPKGAPTSRPVREPADAFFASSLGNS